jgi:hypothetical protein
LPDASKALAPCIWLLASEYPDGEITASRAAIAFRLHISEGKLESALKPLIDSGFIIDASALLADCYQHASLEKEEEREKEKDIWALSRPGCDKEFENFWKSYPKREGANPKYPARKAFLAAVKAGADPLAIVAGAKGYAAHPSTKVATEYVAQAATWLRQRRWEDFARAATDSQQHKAEEEAENESRKVYWLNRLAEEERGKRA